MDAAMEIQLHTFFNIDIGGRVVSFTSRSPPAQALRIFGA